MKEKIEMKNDGHDQERFRELLQKVVTVPKEELVKREKEAKRTKKRRK